MVHDSTGTEREATSLTRAELVGAILSRLTYRTDLPADAVDLLAAAAGHLAIVTYEDGIGLTRCTECLSVVPPGGVRGDLL